jgi:Mg2+ and Co2+ transporter CorA
MAIRQFGNSAIRQFGYPLALVLMVCSAIKPFWYFRRRGWLN